MVFFNIVFACLSFVFIGVILSLLIVFIKNKIAEEKSCVISINGKKELSKEAKAGSNLLLVLLQNHIPIPSPCGGKATCKQCKVQVVQGAGPILEPDKATFSKKELEKGWRLSCQCKIKQDVSITLPEAILDVQTCKAKVISNNNVSTFIKELVVELEENTNIEYKPGAYMQLHIPAFTTNTSTWKKTIGEKYFSDWEKYRLFDTEIDYSSLSESVQRAYSLASFPMEKKTLKFTIRIATPPIQGGKVTKKPWGIGSSYAFSLLPGQEVSLSGPYGESFMIENEKPLIFLIGGAGASFARSHIMHLFVEKNSIRELTLWYGARSLQENIYEEEFVQLSKKHPSFRYKLVLSEPLPADIGKGWPTKEQDPIRTNFAYKAFELGQLKELKDPDEYLYYVCGPPMHNQSVMALLDSYGVPRKNIVLDDFGN